MNSQAINSLEALHTAIAGCKAEANSAAMRLESLSANQDRGMAIIKLREASMWLDRDPR